MIVVKTRFVLALAAAVRHRPVSEGDSNKVLGNRFIRTCARLWAAAAAALLAGPVDAATKVVYDSTNFYTSGTGITSLDKNAIFGDSLHLTATGKLTSFTWAAFNAPNSSTDLTGGRETISFFRQSDGSKIGSFDAIIDLSKGTSKTYTADLGGANLVLDTPDILVTQQFPYLGLGTYRLGIVIATESNTPTIGTTNAGYYLSQFGQAGNFFTNVNFPSYSSAVYQAVVLPDVTWNTTSGTWNTSTANWTTGSGPNEAFSDGYQTTFNNASGGAVILSGALAPRAVVVSATAGAYYFVASDGNQITGAATLSKSGSGSLFLAGPNAYTGGTTLDGGTLTVGNAESIGSSGTISFGGGTLQYSGSNTTDYSSRFSNAANQRYSIDTDGLNVTLAADLSSSGGSLAKSGAGTLTLSGSNSYSGGTTVSAGTLVGNTASLHGAIANGGTVRFDQATTGTFSGAITGAGALEKAGAGKLVLSGVQAHSGPSAVQAGTLSLSGTIQSSPVTVDTGATLAGNGFIGSSLSVLGTLAPGDSPGRIEATTVSLASSATTLMEIVAAGTAGSNYDTVVVDAAGGLTYGGTLSLMFSNSSPFADGTTFDLFGFTGSPGGAFSSITASGIGDYAALTFALDGDGTWTTSNTPGGQYLKFSPLTGDLVIVPEPSTVVSLGIAAAAFVAGQRWRRRKAAGG